jgi:4-hydroxyphenylpyruvate dioxygenase
LVALPVPWSVLRRNGILVDADERGLLYQIFTRPITERDTFFFEFIQRAGATGFGANNVRALYDALQATLAEHRPAALRGL